jgi:hypothetical protein
MATVASFGRYFSRNIMYGYVLVILKEIYAERLLVIVVWWGCKAHRHHIDFARVSVVFLRVVQ